MTRTGGGGTRAKGQLTQRSIISYQLYDSPKQGSISPVTVRGLQAEEELMMMGLNVSQDSARDDLSAIPLI